MATPLTVQIPDELYDFLVRKTRDLQRRAPTENRKDVTLENVLLGYAEVGRRHEAASRARLRKKLTAGSHKRPDR